MATTGKIYFNGVDANSLPAVVEVAVTSGALSMTPPWTLTEVNLATAVSQTVTAAPCIVGKIWVTVAMNAYAATINDDTTLRYTVPLSSALSTVFTVLEGSAFLTSLKVGSNASSTGKITIQWRAA